MLLHTAQVAQGTKGLETSILDRRSLHELDVWMSYLGLSKHQHRRCPTVSMLMVMMIAFETALYSEEQVCTSGWPHGLTFSATSCLSFTCLFIVRRGAQHYQTALLSYIFRGVSLSHSFLVMSNCPVPLFGRHLTATGGAFIFLALLH